MTQAATPAGLSLLAHRCGLSEYWTDALGRQRQVKAESLRALLHAMGVACACDEDIKASTASLDQSSPSQESLRVVQAASTMRLTGLRPGRVELIEEGADQPARLVDLRAAPHGVRMMAPSRPGYYLLRQTGGPQRRIAVTPQAPDLAALLGRARARSWGLMAQVYSLRQDAADAVQRTWGHGDFATVAELARRLAAEGADVLALNPLHAMNTATPAACSPYSPSSRLFLNVLYGAPALVLGHAAVREALAALPSLDLVALDGNPLIDWPAAAKARLDILGVLHRQFSRQEAALQNDYAGFLRLQGQPLRDHAVFEAISHAQAGRPWPQWDSPLRNPRSAAVEAFAAAHPEAVDFHCFAQWVAARSLAQAQSHARAAGMGLGLMSDLAVGVSPAGSQVWSDPASFLQGVSIGAPPDIHQPLGQSWGLAGLSPIELQRRGYEPFLQVLRAALEHTGGARIDHILGFERLWLVPDGGDPAAGAYVRMPAAELLGLTALEAWRHRSLVIGEDLGTLPEDFDQRLRDHGIAGMNVLWFMRANAQPDAPFLAPAQWPAQSAALTSTHDLPTLSGWWHGTDIRQRQQAGRLSAAQMADSLLAERQADKAALWQMMLPEQPLPDAAPAAGLLALVASAPCALSLASLEDIAGEDEAPNVPGTTDEFPNWRRRLPGDTLAGLTRPDWQQRLHAMQAARETA